VTDRGCTVFANGKWTEGTSSQTNSGKNTINAMTPMRMREAG
jgi:hypothetical protein